MSKCSCEKTAAFLARIGAKHTARMHARDAASSSGNWTTEDWLIHMKEEEDYLCPLLRRYGFAPAADRIEAEHRILRASLRRNHTMDATLLMNHSRFEDQIVVELERRMGLR